MCSEKQLSCRKKGNNKTHKLHNSSFRSYYFPGPISNHCCLPSFYCLTHSPQVQVKYGEFKWEKKKLTHSLSEIPRKCKYCIHMHTGILFCFLFLQSHSFSQALDTNSQVIHRDRRLLDLVFSCLLILTPTKNYWRYETAVVTKTIKQLHSCGVLSFLFRSVTHRFTKISSW